MYLNINKFPKEINMNKLLVFLLCFSVILSPSLTAKGTGGSHGGGGHSSPSHSSSHISSTSKGVRSGSKNAGKIGAGGSKGIRSFSKSSTPKSIGKYLGKPFSRPRTVSVSRGTHRGLSYTYSRPVIFSNPYSYYYLMSRQNYQDSVRVDTNAFPGFGNGKSGGGGASIAFKDSLRQQAGKSSLEISELSPINFLSDYANIIPDPDEPKINYLIRNYKKITGVEVAVLTIPTLGDEIDLEDYAQVLFDKWGIGVSGADNGVLIIISSEDEILRIQPGYGLEELLPDATCREIEDKIMIPACQKQQWEGAVIGAIKEITGRLGNQPVEIMKRELVARQAREHQALMNIIYTSVAVIAVLAFIILIMVLIVKVKKRATRKGLANYQRLDAKLDLFGQTYFLMKKTKITQDDVGKIFFTGPQKKRGSIISNEDFLLLDADTVGGWVKIGQLDVNDEIN
jgi:uncharacterized membrane protein YgcG